MLQTLELVALVPVALCTVVNACSVVTVRPLGGGRRLDARAAVWSALGALLGCYLLISAAVMQR